MTLPPTKFKENHLIQLKLKKLTQVLEITTLKLLTQRISTNQGSTASFSLEFQIAKIQK